MRNESTDLLAEAIITTAKLRATRLAAETELKLRPNTPLYFGYRNPEEYSKLNWRNHLRLHEREALHRAGYLIN